MKGRVLVTGASGFVGRILVPLLRTRGHRVRAVVRDRKAVVRGAEETVTVDNIGPDTDWTSALFGMDAVVHLAARAHVMRDRAADPLEAFRQVNTAGTARLAATAAAVGIDRFVYMSSIKAVADEGQDHTIGDATEPDPHSPYGISKLEAERELAAIAAASAMEMVVLRPPLVYGPGVKGNFLSLLKLCQRGMPLPLAGIVNRRSVLYVGNLADAVDACLTRKEAAGQTFVLHDGPALSTPELVRRLSAALGRDDRLFRLPPAVLSVLTGLGGRRGRAVYDRLARSMVVDDQRIRHALGWSPPHKTGSGLQATADWFKAGTGGMAR
jgi:nucleoside-diphosphate-sugar epimerase